MKQDGYFESMFSSFIGGLDDEKLIFIKYYNEIQLSKQKIKEMAEENGVEMVLFHTYIRGAIKSPYEPFVDMIGKFYREFYSDRFTLKEFLEECGVYPLQISSFETYLESGISLRQEPALPVEQNYEQKKAYESVMNCLKYVSSEHKLLLVLDKLQYANISTIRVIQKIMDDIKNISFKLCITIDDKNKIKAYVSEEYQNMMRVAKEEKMVYEWHGYKASDTDRTNDYFRAETEYIHEYIEKVQNLYNLMALEDAEFYLNNIYVRIEEDKANIADLDKFKLYTIGVCNYIMMNNPKSALLTTEKLYEYTDNGKNDVRTYVYNYLCALAYVFMIQAGNSKKYIKKCREISDRYGDEEMDFYTMLLEITDEYGGWHSIFNVDFGALKYDEGKAKRLEEHRFYNVLSRYYSYGSDNSEEEIKLIIKDGMSEAFKRAIRIGKYLKNNNFLLSVNTKYISRFTDLGYYGYAFNFYDSKLKVLREEGNKKRMANQMMGLGYNFMIAEKYDEAGKYFHDAIEILYELKDSEAIGEALYNLAMNSICVVDFEAALKYLQLMFRILEHLNVESIVMCNPAKLYGLLGLTYYHLGNIYKSYTNLETINTLVRGYTGNKEKMRIFRRREDMFYYHYLNGCLKYQQHDIDGAYAEYNAAKEYYDTTPAIKACMIECYMGDYYILLRDMGKDDEAESIMNSAMEYCMEHNYSKKMDMLTYIKENCRQPEKEKLPDFVAPESEEKILEMTFNVGKREQLIERKRDIRFLSMLQEVLGKDDVELKYHIENAVKLICDNFDMDELLLISVDNDNLIEELYCSDDINVKDSYKNIVEYFKKNKNEFYVNRISSDMYEYKKIIDIFYSDDMLTITCIPVYQDKNLKAVLVGIVNQDTNVKGDMKLFDDENLAILKTASIQLIASVERLKNKMKMEQINDRLKKMAITDMLTGLYNRQGFDRMIDQMENHKEGEAILYIDLDNFKHCNDTFGHDVGDLILRRFAEVLEKVVYSKGFVVRYGGDEFIIVLTNAGKEDAIEVSEEIYKNIEHGFVGDIEEYLGRKINICDDKKLTTSIGIAVAKDCARSTINETIKKADDMLYSVKHDGKGSYRVWSEICT